MRRFVLFIPMMIAVAVMLAACSEAAVVTQPRLVAQSTVEPESVSFPTAVPTVTIIRPTQEVQSPLENITVEAEFILVTPTLPPSKTPTLTPTITPSPTVTPSPTQPVTATATTFLLPTSEIVALTAPAQQPIPRVCDSTWFFIEPRPASCPLNPPLASQGVYQTFQNGYMVWVGSQDAIYVLYNDSLHPRWQVFRDYFNEGMPEDSSQFTAAPQAGLWQPRRGFGMLWRGNTDVRNRIGWATLEWEQPYSVQTQTSNDGSIFFNTPTGAVFTLLPGNVEWRNMTVAGGGLPPIYGSQPTPNNGLAPIYPTP